MSHLTKPVVYISLVLILFFSVQTATGLYGRFTQTNEARRDNKATWHKVICHIERDTVKGLKKPYSKRVNKTLIFFDDVLVNDVNTARCGIYSGGKP